MGAADGICKALSTSLLCWFPSFCHPGTTEALALVQNTRNMCMPVTEAVSTLPNNLKLIAVNLRVIPCGGATVAARHMNWCDVS